MPLKFFHPKLSKYDFQFERGKTFDYLKLLVPCGLQTKGLCKAGLFAFISFLKMRTVVMVVVVVVVLRVLEHHKLSFPGV